MTRTYYRALLYTFLPPTTTASAAMSIPEPNGQRYLIMGVSGAGKVSELRLPVLASSEL